jgi:hypothetical protein
MGSPQAPHESECYEMRCIRDKVQRGTSLAPRSNLPVSYLRGRPVFVVSGVVIRRALILAAAAALVVPPVAAAQPDQLMPGVTFSREVQFTPHGPVVIDVLVSPRPTGLWGLHPVLANGVVPGTLPLTQIQKAESTDATVAGTNGDLFAPADGRPAGMVLQTGVLEAPPNDARSSLGIDASGSLRVQRVALFGTWRGLGQRRPLNGLNQTPGTNGISLYTPSWGPKTPALPGDYEAVLAPLPAALPNADLVGTVVAVNRGGGNSGIPPNGAVLVARGVTAQKLQAEAPVGTPVTIRLGLKPDWGGIVDAIGGGPVIVRDGKPVFRSFEAFAPDQILPRQPRTAVGQAADGRIIQVVVDGRQPGYSVGMTNFELAQTLARLGAVTGMALDPGDSSTMAFDGGLLSRPSGPAGERPVEECLCVFYYGVYAPPPAVAVVSPNGDGVDETQSLAFKVVRHSSVTATLTGPDGTARISQAGDRDPGVYKVDWTALDANGQPEVEGPWKWTISATDDLGRTSTITRTFSVNDTLGFLRVPARATVRPGGLDPVVARFQVAHPARIAVRIETTTGVVLKTLPSRAVEGAIVTVKWDGRTDRGVLVYSGRYVVHVTATNELGPASLSQALSVKRVLPKPRPRPKKKHPH